MNAKVYTDNGCLLIAEVGQAHDGSIGACHAFIDAVGDSGADAIKFQMHIANRESTYDDTFREGTPRFDRTRFDYWKRMEFSREQWEELANHARDKNLKFLASIFSTEALHMLVELNAPAVKIASGEVTNFELIKEVKKTRLPVFLSTGMSTWGEIDSVVGELQKESIELTIMQCTSKYPTPLSEVGLNILGELRGRYQTKIGLSDHSGTIYPSLSAIAQGVDAVEVHVVFDRRMFGLDATSSVTIDDLRLLANYRDAVEQMNNHPAQKDKVAEKLFNMKALFGRSIALNQSLPRGSILMEKDICLKKPGTGIKPSRLGEVVGRKLKRDVESKWLLKWDDFE